MFRTGCARIAVAASLCLMAVLGGCGGLTPADAADELGEALRARHAAAAGIRPFTTIAEVLPNTRYERPDGTAAPIAELVVVGHVSDVEKGRGFYVEGADAPGGTETTFDDSRALWRTVHAHVAVETVIAGSTTAKELVVGLAFGTETPFEVPEKGLPALGDVVLFLQKSPVFAYDDSIYSIVLDGALMAEVTEGGALNFPALEPSEAASLQARGTTVAELREAARGPGRVVKVDATGARVD